MLSFKFVASSVSKRGFENAVKRNFSTTRNMAKPLPTFVNQKLNTPFRTNTNISSVFIPNKLNQVRFYSTPTDPVSVPPPVTPVPTPVPTPTSAPTPALDIPTDADVTKLIDVLNTSLQQPLSVLEPLLYPSEWWRSLMHLLHDNVGLPWWATLCTMAFITRLFTFPLAVRNMKNAPATKARSEELASVMQEMRIASQLGEQAKALELQRKMAALWSPKDMLINLIPMPIFVTAFIGISGIVHQNIPSLHNEGLLWFKDLALADPYYGLPTASLIFGALSFVFVDAPMAQMRKMLPIMLILICVGFYATRNVPAGLHVYWSSAAFIGLLQVILLRKTPLKRILKIPDNPHSVMPSMPSILPKTPEVKPPPPKLFSNPPSFNMYKNAKKKGTNVDDVTK